MTSKPEPCPRQLAFHGVLGALSGAALVLLLLALNVAGLSTMIEQVGNPAVYLAMFFMKPMMLFGVIAVGWSIWRQVSPEVATLSSRFDLAKRLGFFDQAMAAR